MSRRYAPVWRCVTVALHGLCRPVHVLLLSRNPATRQSSTRTMIPPVGYDLRGECRLTRYPISCGR